MDLIPVIVRFLLIAVAIVVLSTLLDKWLKRRAAKRNWNMPSIPPRQASGVLDRTSDAPVSVPQRKTLDLDITTFAPLSDAQIQAAAGAGGGASLWGSALFLFGRRDLIPPADDPRTNLIDRGMVAHGFITPEELLEVHKIGAEMDAVRPDIAVAAHRAQQAVADDREARKALREQKKRAAEERKQAHAQAVKARKATDIIFLGRGVSRGLADRRSNVEKLRAKNLPVLATPADVAQALGLTIPKLRWLAFHSDAATVSHYVYFTVPKKSGGVRQLAAPHEQLAHTQEWILTNILEKIAPHDAANGMVKSRSTVTNARPHVGKAVVVNCDLRDFFPTISFFRAAGILREMGYSPAVATILGLLCTESPRREVEYDGRRFFVATGPRALPQGACTSPALSNLCARRLDSRLSGIVRKLDWTYTRYADDLTFSADGETAERVGYLLARIRHIAQDEGFVVNEKKTRVLRRSAAQSVTGIIVNDKPGVRREVVRRLRAILHRARTEGLQAQNRRKLPHFPAHVRGMIAYIHMIDPARGQQLRQRLAAVKP